MVQLSSIEWTDRTSNPFKARRKDNGKVGWHCNKCSTGCAFCYAEPINIRFGTGLPFAKSSNDLVEVFLSEPEVASLLKLKKPSRIFPCDMTDLFFEDMPNELIAAFFAVMMCTPEHTYQVLTKRAERLPEWFAWVQKSRRGYWRKEAGFLMDCLGKAVEPETYELAKAGLKRATRLRWPDLPDPVTSLGDSSLGPDWPLPNVWLGTSVENQEAADARIPHLLRTPAAVRFLSVEPLLGPVDLGRLWWETNGDSEVSMSFDAWVAIHWVIVGGESGPKARPMHPHWAMSIRDQCVEAGVPFFFKQWGEWSSRYDWNAKAHIQLHRDGRTKGGLFPDHSPGWDVMCRHGKRAAGRLLDGREWSEFPTTTRGEVPRA